MKARKILPVTAAMVFVPAIALALDMEFYTYGGHDAIVNAFNKCALIFNSQNYKSLFAGVLAASLAAWIARGTWQLMFGGSMSSIEQIGKSNVMIGAIVPWFISVAFFSAMVIPKGTLHIYDEVENKYQAIGGIPNIVVISAGLTNLIERGLVQMVATSGDPKGFLSQAGGKGFMGLFRMTTQPLTSLDTALDATLYRYIDDCITFELLRPGATLTVDELRKTSTNLVSSLAKGINPANFTTVFDPALNPAGEAMTCTDAWNNIQTRLANDANFKDNLVPACGEMGFNPSNMAELNTCTEKLNGILTLLGPGITSVDFIRQNYISQQLERAYNKDGAFANFQMLTKASGTMSSFNEWQPYIRAAFTAITVSMMPFLALLIPTPYMSRALKYLFGSFVFLAVWGVVDASMHQFVIDFANRLYEEIRINHMGMDALYFFPGTTEKVLAMFGMMRAGSLAIAVTVTGVLGLAVLGGETAGKTAGDVTATAGAAEQKMLSPAGRAQEIEANLKSIPTQAMANEYSFQTRQGVEMSRTAGEFRQQLGALSGAGGMDGYLGMRQGQGMTTSYRGQGDVGLNQAFMKQADAMGIPKEAAQKIAAATVNHGEGLAELRRLQAQGFSGQKAADVYWQGKTVDHMQGKSVGQQQGFTMFRPVEGQEQGKWGQVQATWQDGQMVGLQGNTVNVASTEQLRASYDKAYSQAISESYRADQSLGESVTRSWGNSATWSQTQAAAQQLYTATNGSVDYTRAINSTMMNSFRNSQIVDERTGQSVDKAAFAQVTAGAGTPQISPVKANIEGGASWRVTTSDGKSYVVNQSAEQARSMSTSVGETHRTTLSTVRSGQYSETAQKALAQMESVQGTRTASETATISYSRANELRESQGQAHSRAAEISANLTRDFYRYVSEQQFGGGAEGDREAIRHVEGLAASGQTKELDALKEQYLSARNINIESLGEDLTKVKGPDMSKAPDPEVMKAKIEGGTAELKTELDSQPNIKATDPTTQVQGALQQTNVGAVNPEEIKAEIATNNKVIQDGTKEVESKGQQIKTDYTAGALPLAARKTVEAAVDAGVALKQSIQPQQQQAVAPERTEPEAPAATFRQSPPAEVTQPQSISSVFTQAPASPRNDAHDLAAQVTASTPPQQQTQQQNQADINPTDFSKK